MDRMAMGPDEIRGLHTIIIFFIVLMSFHVFNTLRRRRREKTDPEQKERTPKAPLGDVEKSPYNRPVVLTSKALTKGFLFKPEDVSALIDSSSELPAFSEAPIYSQANNSMEFVECNASTDEINPATGMPILGGTGGVDLQGNAFGSSDSLFDDNFSSPFENNFTSSFDDPCSSFDSMGAIGSSPFDDDL